MANTTADKLALAAANKVAIKAAIEAKNPATAPTDAMSQWPTAIASIPTGEEPFEQYDGDDTVLDIEIEYDDLLTFEIYIQPLRVGVCYIDWGDGTQTEPLDFTAMTLMSHTYSAKGHYEVRVKNVEGVTGLTFTHSVVGNFAISYSPYQYGPNLPQIRKLLIGTNYDCSVPNQLIYSWQSLLELNINPANTSTKFGANGVWNTFGVHTPSRSLKRIAYVPYSRNTGGSYSITNFFALEEIIGLDIAGLANCSSMFSNCSSLQRVPDVLDLSACTNCSSMFSGCSSLQRVPDVLDLSACTNCSSMFSGCYALQRVPDVLDLSACTNCSSMFSGCYALQRVPDVLDLSANTSTYNMFYNCVSLAALPTHVTTNLGISFAQSKLVSKDSVATFDGSGNVVGGFVGNLNSCPDSGQTMTFHADTKAKFTADEWEAVKSALAAKNWGCSPA